LGPIREFDSNPEFRGSLTPRQSFRQGRLLLVSLLEVFIYILMYIEFL
jgi:hypothetical protein